MRRAVPGQCRRERALAERRGEGSAGVPCVRVAYGEGVGHSRSGPTAIYVYTFCGEPDAATDPKSAGVLLCACRMPYGELNLETCTPGRCACLVL